MQIRWSCRSGARICPKDRPIGSRRWTLGGGVPIDSLRARIVLLHVLLLTSTSPANEWDLANEWEYGTLSQLFESSSKKPEPFTRPGVVVGAVHGRRGTRAAATGAPLRPGAAWYVVAPDGSPGPPNKWCFLSCRPKFGPAGPFCLTGLRAQTAMPCIGPSTASHPVEHEP